MAWTKNYRQTKPHAGRRCSKFRTGDARRTGRCPQYGRCRNPSRDKGREPLKMAVFLSSEWFDELAETLLAITVGEPSQTGLALGQVILNTQNGTVNYTICLGGGRPGSLVRDSVDAAQVTLVEDY